MLFASQAKCSWEVVHSPVKGSCCLPHWLGSAGRWLFLPCKAHAVCRPRLLATPSSCAPSFFFFTPELRWRKQEGGYAIYACLATSVPALSGSTLGDSLGFTGCLSRSVTPWMIRSRAASLNPKPVAGSAGVPASVDILCCSVGRVEDGYDSSGRVRQLFPGRDDLASELVLARGN